MTRIDEFDIPSPDARIWYVLHVKPRTEKKVAWYLGLYKCFHHLPVRIVIRKVQRRKVRRELPLFPGYVFARMNADQRREMLQTNLLVRTIPIPRPRETIHELRQLRRGASTQAEMRVLSTTFHEGDKVRVTTGPMRGMEGYVKRDGAGRTVIYLNVEILGRSVQIEIQPCDVEKI